MRLSTALLVGLGILVLFVGLGSVVALPAQVLFSDNYPARDYTALQTGLGYPASWYTFYVGDAFVLCVPSGAEVVQVFSNPRSSLNYLGGFLASDGPVNVSIRGVWEFYGAPLVEMKNVVFASYFTDLYSNPSAFAYVALVVENSGGTPVFVVGQSRQWTLSVCSNPLVALGYSLLALGVFLAFVGFAEWKWRPEPLRYIPSTVGETISTGLKIWKRIFAATVIPYGALLSVYELIYFLGYSYAMTNLGLPGSTGIVEAYAARYGLPLIGYFFMVVAIGIVIKATSDVIEGNELSVTGNIRHVFRRSGKMYVAYIVSILIIGLTMLLIVPGIYFAIVFSVVLPAIVVADHGAFESLRTSKMLTENDKLRTLGVLLASGLLAAAASIPLFIIAFYAFPPLPLKSDILTLGVQVTSRLIVFTLPQTLAFITLVSVMGSITAILGPIIITTWFYALGGAYERVREIYIKSRFGKTVKNCPNCGRTIPEESKFCPYCGQKQT